MRCGSFGSIERTTSSLSERQSDGLGASRSRPRPQPWRTCRALSRRCGASRWASRQPWMSWRGSARRAGSLGRPRKRRDHDDAPSVLSTFTRQKPAGDRRPVRIRIRTHEAASLITHRGLGNNRGLRDAIACPLGDSRMRQRDLCPRPGVQRDGYGHQLPIGATPRAGVVRVDLFATMYAFRLPGLRHAVRRRPSPPNRKRRSVVLGLLCRRRAPGAVQRRGGLTALRGHDRGFRGGVVAPGHRAGCAIERQG
jgi:hypothetical protein